jgi:hypothetical protein
MNKLLLTSAGILFCAIRCFAQLDVPQASLTIKVLDETATPVKDAQASIWSQDTVKELQKTGVVDEKGVFSAEMPAFGVLHYSASNPAFYSTWSEYRFKHGAMKGDPSTWSTLRWEPWNPIVEVVLKAKGPLRPMYAKRVRIIDLPEREKGIGYDFELGDWVAPHGKGKSADLIFTGNGEVANGTYRLRWTFWNPCDGIRVLPLDAGTRCELKSPKEAPAEGYAPGLEINSEGRVVGADGRLGERPACILFRVRTVLDEKGKVVSAHYGKMYPEQLNVVYYLNPEPNSRSLEYDPARNLFGKLPGSERINDY